MRTTLERGVEVHSRNIFTHKHCRGQTTGESKRVDERRHHPKLTMSLALLERGDRMENKFRQRKATCPSSKKLCGRDFMFSCSSRRLLFQLALHLYVPTWIRLQSTCTSINSRTHKHQKVYARAGKIQAAFSIYRHRLELKPRYTRSTRHAF